MRKKLTIGIIMGLVLTLPLAAESKRVHYSFTSRWEIEAPLVKVWDLIDKGEDWHLWWKSVVASKIIQAGDAAGNGQIIRYTWKALLPLTLTINFKITNKEKYKRIEGVSSGDLEGTGTWTFEEHKGITTIQYNWEVESTKKLVNFLSPVFKGFFIYNHNLIMRRGGRGLASKLRAMSYEP